MSTLVVAGRATATVLTMASQVAVRVKMIDASYGRVSGKQHAIIVVPANPADAAGPEVLCWVLHHGRIYAGGIGPYFAHSLVHFDERILPELNRECPN
jgi:hypothetical protein